MEALNAALVTDLLRASLDPALECVALERGALGNAQETWFVDARRPGGAERQLVLRRSAGAGALASTDLGREVMVLGALADRGFPVPRVHWLEGEPSALGRPYFVMDRMPGVAPARAAVAERRVVGLQLGGWLARLHALDPAEATPELTGAASATAASRDELGRWQLEYLRTRPGPVPLLGALLAWLQEHLPETDAPVRLLWGDAGPHNMLVNEGSVSGLLDWELAHLGDPLEDLGAAVWACLPGTLEAEDVVAGYEAEAGPVDRERLRYFEALACATRSVMLVAGVASFLGGDAGPTAAALGQHLLLDNLGRAAAIAGWEPGPLDGPPPILRPDPTETVTGVARYLREAVLPVVGEPRVRRELKTAVALLETAARRDAGHASQEDDETLEAAATRAERDRSADRAGLRARLLAGLAAHRIAIEPLDDLYRRRR